jgi:hypothetical protein
MVLVLGRSEWKIEDEDENGEDEDGTRQNKSPLLCPFHSSGDCVDQAIRLLAHLRDVRGARALLAFFDFERYDVVLSQALEAAALNRRMMNEHVRAAVVRRNEAKALLITEPLHLTLRHVSFLSCACLGTNPHHGEPPHCGSLLGMRTIRHPGD